MCGGELDLCHKPIHACLDHLAIARRNCRAHVSERGGRQPSAELEPLKCGALECDADGSAINLLAAYHGL